MKKIIPIIYFKIYVDILGFPVYLKHTIIQVAHKKRNEDKFYYTNKSKTLFIEELIKQH